MLPWTKSWMLLCVAAGTVFGGWQWAFARGLTGKGSESVGELRQDEAFPWESELDSLAFEFALGDRLHLGTIRDPEVLGSLHKEWRVVQRIPEAPAPNGPTLLGRSPAVLMKWKAGPAVVFRLAGRNQLHHPDFGRLILSPGWFRSVEAWASEQEDASVRLGVENRFPPSRLESLRRFQSARDSAWVQGTLQGPEGRVEARGSAVLSELAREFKGMYVPNQRNAGSAWGHTLRVQTVGDLDLRFELRDGSQAPTRPLRSVLLQHKEWGLVWVDDDFRRLWLDLYRVPNPLSVPAGEPAAGIGTRPNKALHAAESALKELALPSKTSLIYRTTDWDLENQEWVPTVFAVPAGSLPLDWRGLWLEAKVSLSPQSQTELDDLWRSKRRMTPMLLWTDGSGQRRIFFGEASEGMWMDPHYRVQLPGDPWEALQAAIQASF